MTAFYILTEWYSEELQESVRNSEDEGIPCTGGNQYSIVGVFSTEEKANKAAKICEQEIIESYGSNSDRTYIIESVMLDRFVTGNIVEHTID